ncbi:hypothetical protein [Tardiphaga sp.]|nr:hypothetical protein [Tardiphaga sp.]
MIYRDTARSIANDLNQSPEWKMGVEDHYGKTVYRLNVIAETINDT